VLAHDLIDAGLGDVEGVVEYQLPQNSKRANVVCCAARIRRRGRTCTSSWRTSRSATGIGRGTAQGFECPWDGVILGPDLVRGDSKDPELVKRTASD
jgi:hypothetical protein